MIGQARFIEAISFKASVGRTYVPNIVVGQSAWQNPYNRFDVNGDGTVDLDDYKALQSWLFENGEGSLDPIRPDDSLYLDVNGDRQVTNQDLILLSRFINEGTVIDKTPEESHPYSGFEIHRELFESQEGLIVRHAAAHARALPTEDFRAFSRNWHTGALTEISFSDPIETKGSYIFIANSLFLVSDAAQFISQPTTILDRVKSYLGSHQELLPARFVWG